MTCYVLLCCGGQKYIIQISQQYTAAAHKINRVPWVEKIFNSETILSIAVATQPMPQAISLACSSEQYLFCLQQNISATKEQQQRACFAVINSWNVVSKDIRCCSTTSNSENNITLAAIVCECLIKLIAWQKKMHKLHGIGTKTCLYERIKRYFSHSEWLFRHCHHDSNNLNSSLPKLCN